MTLNDIKSRCREDGDCLIWTGSTNAAGHPKYVKKSARRVVWEIAYGPLQPSELVTVTCGCSLCLEPKHLKKTNKSEVSKISNNRPHVRAKRAVKAAATNRPKMGKITMDIAREIRMSNKSGLEWAAELNVSPSLISSVRRNRSWREHVANPFAGLLA